MAKVSHPPTDVEVTLGAEAPAKMPNNQNLSSFPFSLLTEVTDKRYFSLVFQTLTF